MAPTSFILEKQDTVECLTEGLVLGAYQFKKYKKKEDEDEKQGEVKEIQVFTVITSYSIHYTKLYEAQHRVLLGNQEREARAAVRVAPEARGR